MAAISRWLASATAALGATAVMALIPHTANEEPTLTGVVKESQ